MNQAACGQVLELCDGTIFLNALLGLLLPLCGTVVETGERGISEARRL